MRRKVLGLINLLVILTVVLPVGGFAAGNLGSDGVSSIYLPLVQRNVQGDPEPVIPETTKVLDEDTTQYLALVSEDGSEYAFSQSTAGLDDLDPGMISLSPIRMEDGSTLMAVAVEGDWHDIPSIRKLIKGDIDIVASKVRYISEQGAYFAFKEAFKKVLPNEYKMLHELKEILTARNMLSNL